jgi:hypothetical protein
LIRLIIGGGFYSAFIDLPNKGEVAREAWQARDRCRLASFFRFCIERLKKRGPLADLECVDALPPPVLILILAIVVGYFAGRTVTLLGGSR